MRFFAYYLGILFRNIIYLYLINRIIMCDRISMALLFVVATHTCRYIPHINVLLFYSISTFQVNTFVIRKLPTYTNTKYIQLHQFPKRPFCLEGKHMCKVMQHRWCKNIKHLELITVKGIMALCLYFKSSFASNSN